MKLVKLRHDADICVSDTVTLTGARVVGFRQGDGDDVLLTPTEARSFSRALQRQALAVDRLKARDRAARRRSK